MLLVLTIIVIDSLQVLLLEQINDVATPLRIQIHRTVHKVRKDAFVKGFRVENLGEICKVENGT